MKQRSTFTTNITSIISSGFLFFSSQSVSIHAFTEQGSAQAQGFYSDGKLADAVSIPDSGIGFVHLFTPRNRGFGTNALVQTLTDLASAVKAQFEDAERLQIGDLAKKSGSYISGHGSHQNGLDADVIYLRKNRKEQDLAFQGGFIENFVENGKLSDNFDIERNWFLFKTLSKTKSIQRIFVDPMIKQALCEHAEKNQEIESEIETLRMLRPYPHHQDHFHLRLFCPKDSIRCIPQQSPPEGSGCDQSMTIEEDVPAADSRLSDSKHDGC